MSLPQTPVRFDSKGEKEDTGPIGMVLRGDKTFRDIRCSRCGALLFKMKGRLNKSRGELVDIKCRSCGEHNFIA